MSQAACKCFKLKSSPKFSQNLEPLAHEKITVELHDDQLERWKPKELILFLFSLSLQIYKNKYYISITIALRKKKIHISGASMSSSFIIQDQLVFRLVEFYDNVIQRSMKKEHKNIQGKSNFGCKCKDRLFFFFFLMSVNAETDISPPRFIIVK